MKHLSLPVAREDGYSAITPEIQLWLFPTLNNEHWGLFVNGKCKRQTLDYCFPHKNEYVTTIVPLFSNPKNSSLQSVCSLHFTQPHFKRNSGFELVRSETERFSIINWVNKVNWPLSRDWKAEILIYRSSLKLMAT